MKSTSPLVQAGQQHRDLYHQEQLERLDQINLPNPFIPIPILIPIPPITYYQAWTTDNTDNVQPPPDAPLLPLYVPECPPWEPYSRDLYPTCVSTFGSWDD